LAEEEPILKRPEEENYTVILSFYRSEEGEVIKDISPSCFATLIAEEKGLLWVDFDQPSPQEEEVLRSGFGFHHLSVEDCLGGIHHPKADDFGAHVFAILHTVDLDSPTEELATAEIDAFLGPNFVVTFHREPLECIASLRARCQQDERLLSRGADFLLHDIFDSLVENFMPALDRLDERIDQLEREVLRNPRPTVLAQIMALKRDTLQLRRVVAPQREVINRFSRGDFAVVTPKAHIYFRDIYDHLIRIEDINESLRDVAEGVLGIYLSAVSNRMNEVMKVLSVVATIFFPLTLLAGIYGMNFQYMPELAWRYGYFAVWGAMLIVTAAMLALFRKRRWL